jgi:chemotaxis signal transduction protein
MTAPGFISGATELHDGRPAVVIQPTEVLKAQPEGYAAGSAARIEPAVPVPPRRLAGSEAGTVRLVVVRQGDQRFALPFDCLKEMLPESQVIDVPALGETWEGIFFVRGLCHGLMRLPGNHSIGGSARTKTITLNFPERCGIRVDGAVGDCEIPLGDISPVDTGGDHGFVRMVGTFKWMGTEVTLVFVASGGVSRREGPGLVGPTQH